MPTPSRFVLIALCLVAGAIALGPLGAGLNGQNPSPQLVPRTPQQREQAYEANHRIILNVVATDAAGKPVAGLKPENFTVLDHDQLQKIVTFREVSGNEDSAVHGLLVLDAINGGASGVGHVRKELVKFLEQRHGPLAFPLSIVVVSEAGANESKPSADSGSLIRDLTEMTRHVQSADCNAAQPGADIRDSRMSFLAGGEGQGGAGELRWACLNSHLMESLNALNLLAAEQQNTKGRAIVVWFGPGWPLPPEISTGQIMGGGMKGNLSDAVIDLSTELRQGQVTLDAVSSGGFERAKGPRREGENGNLKNASVAEQESAVALPALARQSGGMALEKSKSIAEAVNAVLSDGDEFYSLSFDPSPGTAPDEYRSIEVKVDRPGTTVRSMTGYYAEP